jgi:23S rRNA (uracil1939-C5)-methyltransferase
MELSREGLGYVRHPTGRSVFVEGGWPGDQGTFRLTRVEKRFGIARIENLVEASPQRRDHAPCAHFGLKDGQCGSCLWISIAYEPQVEAKRTMITRELKAQGAEVPVTMWPAPSEFHYRNRAQFKTDGERLGYVSRGSKTLVDVKDCVILNETMKNSLHALRSQLPRKDWQPTPPYSWNFIEVDDEVVVERLTERNGPIINQRRPFRQGNTEQNLRMKQWLGETCSDWSGQVLELFCGSGNFTDDLVANKKLEVHAVELAEGPLAELRKRHPLVKTKALDLYRQTSIKELIRSYRNTRYLVLDPPRDGFRMIGDLIRGLPKLERVIYISCNLHTFGLDAFDLNKAGFRLQAIVGVDQFPQTPHIEILSHFKTLAT